MQNYPVVATCPAASYFTEWCVDSYHWMCLPSNLWPRCSLLMLYATQVLMLCIWISFNSHPV